jgi:alpha,alpha-trehalase
MRIYIPYNDAFAYTYYSHVQADRPHLSNIEVVRLPEVLSAEFVNSLDGKPGILSLALRVSKEGKVRGTPFVVPGG